MAKVLNNRVEEPKFEVRIFGPNLYDQSKGQFHVHTANCRDCKFYGPGNKYGGDVFEGEESSIEVENAADVVDYIYGPAAGDFEGYEYGDPNYMAEFYFFPCLADLPNK